MLLYLSLSACDFQCGDADNTCVLSKHLCDGTPHCPNGQDEKDCGGIFISINLCNLFKINKTDIHMVSICILIH